MAQTNNTTKLFRIYDIGAGGSAVDLLCIKPDGNVGIGNVQSPLAKLHVKTANIEVSTLAGMNSFSNYSLVLDATNAVGINNTPMFNGSGIAFKGHGALPFASIFYGGDGQGGSLHFATSTSYSAGLNKINMSMRNGNVGIGLTGPAVVLHVKSSSAEVTRLETTVARGSGQNYLAFHDPSGIKGYVGYGSNSTDSIQLINSLSAALHLGTNGVVNLTMLADGKVGIGTQTPSVGLEVAGSIRPTGGTDLPAQVNSNAILVGGAGSPDSGRLIIGDGTGWKYKISNRTSSTTTDLVTFTDNGRVGIGVASPAVALDISGEARSSTSTIATSNAKTLTTKDYVDNYMKVGSVVTFVLPVGGFAVTANTTVQNANYGMPSGWVITSNYVNNDPITFTVPANSGAWQGCAVSTAGVGTHAVSFSNSASVQTVTMDPANANNNVYFFRLTRIS
jgi:hypothetical protein